MQVSQESEEQVMEKTVGVWLLPWCIMGSVAACGSSSDPSGGGGGGTEPACVAVNPGDGITTCTGGYCPAAAHCELDGYCYTGSRVEIRWHCGCLTSCDT
jgi:hypothetical protein